MSKVIKRVSQKVPLLTLAEAKAWLRVRSDSEDVLIQSLIDGVFSWAEGQCKRGIARCSYELFADTFCNVVLENPPNYVISKVSYIAKGTSVYVEIPTNRYQVKNVDFDATLEFLTDDIYDLAERSDAIKVEYESGYTLDDIPQDILIAIRLQLAYLYDNRASENKRFNTSAEVLLYPFRLYNL